MVDITDDSILELAADLAAELDLDEDDRNLVVLRVQRMVWPPSAWDFLHRGEHVSLTIRQREDGRGWAGELRCPQGCGRAWSVQTGPDNILVFDALAAAHEEYRTGRAASTAAPKQADGPRRLRLDDLFQKVEYVEVFDRRLTPEEVSG